MRTLRQRLGITQAELAQEMGVSLQTVVRYENKMPPKGPALARLRVFSEESGHPDLAKVFESEIREEGNQRIARKIRGFLSEHARWQQIGLSLHRLIAESENIKPADLRKRIEDELNQLGKLLAEQKVSTSKARK